MLSYELNSKILKLAPRFEAREIAPDSFEKLKANSTASLVVWSGASDKTIYGDSSVNHAFRAWHDSLHLKLNADFSSTGERLVALEQARLISGDSLGMVLMAEIVGQLEYFQVHGSFPVDQVEFIKQYVKGK
jgi:hypothetical protein